MTRRKLKFWNIPVTEYLDECLERAVQVNSHVSKSDFVRDAVREKLTRMGLMPESLSAQETISK
jgi:Arc/MetJ-type ribon-helix-helix transcriptional regulator